MKKTLTDYLDGGSIWGSVQALSPFAFFDTFPPQKLDALLNILYGDRTVFSKIIPLDLDNVAMLIILNYGDKWEALIKANAVDIDFAAGESNTKTETTNLSVEDVKDSVKTNKVSAFNSEDLVNDGGENVVDNSNTKSDGTKTTIQAKQSLKHVWDNLTMVEKTSIINVITYDVANFTTLTTY